jgi:DNA anti-recombination protein RmuC
MQIELRIADLRAELQALNNGHDQMVAEKQKTDEEFQKRVTQNQNRFQQLIGAIAELENMMREGQKDNGEAATLPRLVLDPPGGKSRLTKK